MKESFAIIFFICTILFLLSFAVYIYFNTKVDSISAIAKKRIKYITTAIAFISGTISIILCVITMVNSKDWLKTYEITNLTECKTEDGFEYFKIDINDSGDTKTLYIVEGEYQYFRVTKNSKEIELYDRVKERLADKERITDENIRLNTQRFSNEKW
jgi:hypothetical protein